MYAVSICSFNWEFRRILKAMLDRKAPEMLEEVLKASPLDATQPVWVGRSEYREVLWYACARMEPSANARWL